jgi:hypothetical protein
MVKCYLNIPQRGMKMAKIKIFPSMALDAICYFEKRFLVGENFHPMQLEFIKKMNEKCGDKLGN